jgi:transposase-like protein
VKALLIPYAHSMQETTPPRSEVTEADPQILSAEMRTDATGLPVDSAPSRRPRLREDQQRQIAHLYAQAGASVADIRQRFGVSEPSVYRVLQKHGVPLRGRATAGSNARASENAVAQQQTATIPKSGTNVRRPAPTRRDVPPAHRGSPNNSATDFRVEFRVERTIDALDIRDALRQTDALGATEIAEITRVA